MTNPSLLDFAGKQTIKGTLERVVFHNEDNGYTVLRLKMQGKTDPVTVVGAMPSPQPGIGLSVTGTWVQDARFGRQFKMESAETLLPASLEGIRHYLGSGLIKGVGAVLAGRIVDAFKEETFQVLDEDPDRLSTIKGLSPRLISQIKTAWSEHTGVRDLIMFLQPHGVSTSYAVRIFRHYGADALAVVKENPYRLAMDIHGIGFATADLIAQKLGILPESPLRAQAGLLFTLRRLTDDGHVFYPFEELVTMTADELLIPTITVEDAVQQLVLEERVVLEELVPDEGEAFQALYLGRYHHCESGIAHYLRRIVHSPKSVLFTNPDSLLEKVLHMLPIELAEEQQEAAHACLTEKLLVVTGGPGTGKTTVINAIIKLFQAGKGKVLLAAPTGRAAKRMTEATGLEAKTIHRLLEYSPKEDGFARNENNPLACSLLVVDEASMLDTVLLYYLLKAVPLGATLVFVGDVNQLPSVGPGNVLKDIIESGVARVVQLTEVFRQAAASEIIMNAHRINQGEVPPVMPPEKGLSDFYFIRQEDPEQAANMVVDLVKNHIPRRFGLDPVEDIQVLTPMHKGEAGVAALNRKLQEALNKNGNPIKRGDRHYHLDDKVMQVRNNYDKDVFNGDIGRICYINQEERELTVRFDERNVLYTFEELDEVTPAYAISVHKSQGSEYPAVVLPVLMQHYMLLQRNLVYTGVTRGKKLVVLVGSVKALSMAVKNNKMHKRYTWLAKRLREGLE
ncbi:SF1B family DNA helicase RecD2 [Desulfovibrio cuneatus]|uniref:SF1B family DNA helicase RecD2 n=1 Tax=Desulfovibrio cuneatus TaxID=159728 RepID=UPI0004012612|nr:ATP-dependent RecD-like DNA helicase [Desulfovibrio cuneatus]